MLESLRRELPEYMVPTVLVAVEEMPLTPNGKVDRKALPEPNFETADNAPPCRAPQNAEEEILAGIVAQALHRPHVYVEENFFQAGGHSLLAMQVISRTRSVFNVDLPVRALFETPTIAGLAERVIHLRTQGTKAKKPAINAVVRGSELELSFAQQRLWFLMQVMPGNTSYNIPHGTADAGGT